MPLTALIILNWNQAEETLECLDSVAQLEGGDRVVIVADNGSTDHSCEKIRERYPDVHLVCNHANLGFAEGNNRGIAYALTLGADYLLLLNNDARIDRWALCALLEAAEEHPDAALFGAKIYYYDAPTTLWYAGGGVNLRRGHCYHVGKEACDLTKEWEAITPTEYACGCALFVKTDAVRQVGMMDPRFFLIWEEIEWCWRIRRAGYRCLFVPKAKVWHKVSRSFEGGNHGPLWQYFYFRNRLLFLKLHAPGFFRSLAPWRDLLRLSFQLLRPDLPKKERALHASALAGFRDYFLGRFGNRKTSSS